MIVMMMMMDIESESGKKNYDHLKCNVINMYTEIKKKQNNENKKMVEKKLNINNCVI